MKNIFQNKLLGSMTLFCKSLMSGSRDGSWVFITVSTFSLLYVLFWEKYTKKTLPYKFVTGNRRSTLVAFQIL